MPLPAIGAAVGAFSKTNMIRAAIAWFVVNVACKLVFRILASLGVGIITYYASQPLAGLLLGYVTSSSSLIDSVQVLSLFNELNVDKALSLLVSFASWRLLTALTRKRLGVRNNPNSQLGCL